MGSQSGRHAGEPGRAEDGNSNHPDWPEAKVLCNDFDFDLIKGEHMAEYLAPGVYVEEVSFRAPSIEGVGTSTAGFAGVTLTGPVGTTPELLTSFGDFQNVYGGYDRLSTIQNSSDPKNNNYLAMSVKAFFDNGGSRLYVSHVFVARSPTDTGMAAAGNLSDSDVQVSARFPGALGNQRVAVALRAAKAQALGA